MGFSFLVGIQLARTLGAEGYGIYGVAMSIIAMLTIPTEFGVPQLLTREVAAAQAVGDVGSIWAVIRWGRRMVLATSVVVAGPVLAWLSWTGKGFSSALGLTLIAGLVMVPLVAVSNLQSASLRGLQHIVKGQIPDTLLRPALYSVLLAVVPLTAALNRPHVAMALGAIAAGGSCLLGTVLLWRALPSGSSCAQGARESRRWLRSAFPMALTEGMRVLQAHVIVLMLGVFSTAAMVGYYRVATSASLFIALVVTIFNVVAAPLISKLYAQSEFGKIQQVLRWLALGMAAGTLVLTLPFLLSGRRIVILAFGEEFAAATIPLIVLCLGALGNSLFGVAAIVLNMTGHERRVTRASLIAVAMLPIAGIPMVKLSGATGASWASVLSMLTWRILLWRDCRRLVGVDPSVLSFFKLWKEEHSAVHHELKFPAD